MSENILFKLAVGTAFPDGSSAKIGRAIKVNQRTVQKWLADEAKPAEGVLSEINVIATLMQDREVMERLRAMAEDWKACDGNPEALASALARVYFEVTGRVIE